VFSTGIRVAGPPIALKNLLLLTVAFVVPAVVLMYSLVELVRLRRREATGARRRRRSRDSVYG
jgi:hypothetical protein